MATRLKTIEFSFPTLASVTNNTLTNWTQITVYIPESSPTFRSVILRVSADDIITATGGSVTTKTLDLRLGAAAYTSVTNSNTMTHSGENWSPHVYQDFTSHFTTNWTGTSMTCDARMQWNHSTGTTTDWVNASATLEITYEYDDTSATHIKTVWLPLDCPVGALATTKPAAIATIPALDTELPEASKTYRDMFIVMQGNMQINGATTDSTISAEIDTLGALTTGNHEGGLASDRWLRYVWNINSLGMTTNATHSWYIWGSVARYNHFQAWLVVTYEFSPGSSTSVFNSVRMPLGFGSPYIGGATSSDYVRANVALWIEEPTTITTKNFAAFLFWEANGNIGGLNARVGTGSFVAYTDSQPANPCGGNGMMVRNDSAYTLARGKNDLVVDCYRTDTTDLGVSFCGFLLVNYTSGKASGGVGAHNHTVSWPLAVTGTGAAASGKSATAQPLIPEADYWVNAVGAEVVGHADSTGTQSFVAMICDRDSATEGFQSWETVIPNGTMTYNGAEVGARHYMNDCSRLFNQYPSDPRPPTRMDIETSRAWECRFGAATGWIHLMRLFFTYHSITFTAPSTGSVSGSSGGTVNIALYDSNGQKVKTTSRTGNGTYSMTWYDSANTMFTEARESSTLIGRSDNFTAA